MERVTMTEPLARPGFTEPLTIDDLHGFSDDGQRYELYDGSLLVSPQPKIPHGRAVTRLHRLLLSQAPDGVFVGQTLGVDMFRRTTYFVPDLLVGWESALDKDGDVLEPAEVTLVVEVLSPSNARKDLVLKRHEYPRAGIPRYWIVDPEAGTLTVLALPERAGTSRPCAGAVEAYLEETVLRVGQPWTTDRPFPLTLDLADVL
jgi:Uma2 family endonuclease